MKSPDRAEHVGSLLRPAELLEARASFADGTLGQEQLREIEDRAILDALEKQSSAGLDRITDGEFRRGSWLTDMAEAVEGFVRVRVVLDWKGPGGRPGSQQRERSRREAAQNPASDRARGSVSTQILEQAV